MKQMVFDRQPAIAAFVSKSIGIKPFQPGYKAIGMRDGLGFMAGVVYENFSGDSTRKYNDCCMHVGSRIGAHWATKEFLHHAFAYPFLQLGCTRVTGLVKADNIKAIQFDERIGFVKEGVIRKGMDGVDLIVYGMLKEECRFI